MRTPPLKIFGYMATFRTRYGRRVQDILLYIRTRIIRIYANVTILRDGAPIETHLNKLSDFGKIPLLESKGVVLIDEASRIYPARSSLSKANKSVIDKYARKLFGGWLTVQPK